MSNIVDSSLKMAAKGTAIVFVGSIIGLLLGFISKVLIVRYTTQAEFGIYSLAIALVSIFSLVSMLGLHEGSTLGYFSNVLTEMKSFHDKNILSKVQIRLILKELGKIEGFDDDYFMRFTVQKAAFIKAVRWY